MQLSWWSFYLEHMKPWGRALVLHKAGVVAQEGNPGVHEEQAEGSGAQGHPWLHNKFKAN